MEDVICGIRPVPPAEKPFEVSYVQLRGETFLIQVIFFFFVIINSFDIYAYRAREYLRTNYLLT